MRSKSRIKGAMIDHENKSLTRIQLMKLKKKYPDKSEDYWKGYYDGATKIYKWVLEK